MNMNFEKSILSRFLQTSGLLIGLILLPVILTFLFLERQWSEEFNRTSETEKKTLEEIVRSYGEALSPEKRLFLSLSVIQERYSKPSRGLEKILFEEFNSLKQEFPGLLEVVIFDGKDRLCRNLSDLPEFHHILASAARDIQAFRQANPEGYLKNQKAYIPFMGPFFKPRKTTYGWELGYVASLNRHRAFFHLGGRSHGGPWALTFITVTENFEDSVLKIFCKTFFPPSSEMKTYLVNLSQPTEDWEGQFGKAGQYLRSAIIQLGQESGKSVGVGGYLWTQIVINPQKRIIICVSDMAEQNYQRAVRTSSLSLGAGMVLLLLLFQFVYGYLPTIPLRYKLLLLFLYVAGVPLGLLVLASQGLFLDKQQVMEKALNNDQLEVLQEASLSMSETLGLFEELGHRILGKRVPAGIQGDSIAIEQMKTFANAVHPDFCCVFNEKGDVIFKENVTHQSAVNQMIPLLGSQISQKIAQYNKTDVGLRESARDQAIKASIESMGMDLDQFLSSLENYPDSIFSISLANNNVVLLAHRIFDRENRLRFMVMGLWGSGTLKALSHKVITQFQKKVPEMTFVSGMWGFLPENRAFHVKISDTKRKMSETSAPVFDRFSGEGKIWFLQGHLGTREFIMENLVMANDEGIQREIRGIGGTLFRIALCLLGMALLIGILISRHLLRPIQNLAIGMEAAKARDFRQRIPVQGSDELGQLALTFNRMMEGMADLEVGRIVHETFFPQKSLSGDGWELFGFSLSASKVGGDYFDYFSLPDGRWFICIGDVSGHGVAAALVVAMAKALTTHASNPGDPSQILAILNENITRTLKRKRLMSCFIAVFDPRNGELVAANAGHNYPFRVQEKRVCEVALRGRPLGVKEGIPFPDGSFSLEPGEWVCFYTDGFIEALNPQGEQIGYERFGQVLPGLLQPAAIATEKAIRSWFETETAGAPLADDATLIILQQSRE